ncbi:hypothetical protein SAZ11_43380 [Streptomyces sp. FXJ1.4098]|nr:hypothetical protein [Streptomyces sp. FXJ1.4098]
MKMPLTRRDFAKSSAYTGVALVGSAGVLATAPGALAAEPSEDLTTTDAAERGGARFGYGPLVADPKGLLALPAGFSYRVITRTGQTKLESGESTPPTTTAPPPSRAPAAPRCSSTTTS